MIQWGGFLPREEEMFVPVARLRLVMDGKKKSGYNISTMKMKYIQI